MPERSLQAQLLLQQYRSLDRRLNTLEGSMIFRLLRSGGNVWTNTRARLGQRLLHSPFHRYYLKVFPPPGIDTRYEKFVSYERSGLPSRPRFNRARAPLKDYPVFSILLATHNPKKQWLEEAVRSVQDQSYSRWELCISDDASIDPWLPGYLKGLEDADSRIRTIRSGVHRGISATLNAAALLTHGDYLGFLDHDDVLAHDALEEYANALRRGGADVLYSDEDKLDADGVRCDPIFKPGWSPELLDSCMYVCHFLAVSRSLFDSLGGLRSEFDGAQDYDLMLRIEGRDPVVCHVPKVLYHWRKHEQSTALHAVSKPYAHDAGKRALESALRQRGGNPTVEDGSHAHTYFPRWQSSSQPLTSVIVCTRSARLIRRCLASLRGTQGGAAVQIVVVNHLGPESEEISGVVSEYGGAEARYSGAFNFSRMVNLGVETSTGDVLLLLNDDVHSPGPDALRTLIEQAMRPKIGAVGGLLRYPSGIIQHAGIALGMNDGAGHPFRGTVAPKYWTFAGSPRDVTAVTGACLATRRTLFGEAGGMDPAFPENYNDVDYCLRVGALGFRVVCDPRASFVHDEAATRHAVVRSWEQHRFFERWYDWVFQEDPYYSPNLSTMTESGELRLGPDDAWILPDPAQSGEMEKDHDFVEG